MGVGLGGTLAAAVAAHLVEPALWLISAVLRLKLLFELKHCAPLELWVVSPRVREEGVHLFSPGPLRFGEKSRVLIIGHICLDKLRQLDAVQPLLGRTEGLDRITTDHRTDD